MMQSLTFVFLLGSLLLSGLPALAAPIPIKVVILTTFEAGADAIVSPDFTGGMRIASAMVRPHVVNFMDKMLHSDEGLRVEEVILPTNFPPTAVSEAELITALFDAMQGIPSTWIHANITAIQSSAVSPGMDWDSACASALTGDLLESVEFIFSSASFASSFFSAASSTLLSSR